MWDFIEMRYDNSSTRYTLKGLGQAILGNFSIDEMIKEWIEITK